MDVKYLKNVCLYVLSAILSLLFIGYIIYHMSASGKETLTTVNAVIVKTDESITLDAYLMRDEQIIYTLTDGLVYYQASDGENVSKEQELANIYSGSEEDRVALMSVEKRLNLLEKSDISDSVTTVSTNIDGAIQSTYFSMLKSVGKGTLSYTEQNMDDLLIQINRRKISVKSVSSYTSAIDECKRQQDALLKSFASAVETVKAPDSGNFYAGADGYEGIFTQAAAKTMTYEDFYKMTASGADATLLQNPYQGKAIGKLTTDSYWSICCEMSNDYIRYVSEGSSYPIEFTYNGGTVLKMKLDRIIVKFGENKSILVFGTRLNPVNFNYLRTQSVRLQLGSYTGYKVPTAAARFQLEEAKAVKLPAKATEEQIEEAAAAAEAAREMKMGVYILDSNKVKYRTFTPLYEVDGYYVAAINDGDPTQLQLYDEIIVQGKDLYAGKYIE